MTEKDVTSLEARLDKLGALRARRLAGFALREEGWEPLAWGYQRLHRTYGTATGGVYRVAGTAAAGGQTRPWSVILKVVSPAAWNAMTAGQPEDPSHPLYWKREVLACESGWLEELPGGVRGPHCMAVEHLPDGSAWLWLEEAQDCYGGDWPLDQYTRAARCLGHFNGAYLARQPWPPYAWLSQTGSPRGVIEAHRALEPLVADPATWDHPLLRATFDRGLTQRLPEFWQQRHGLLDTLEALPQTLCHQDAWRGNAFSPRGAAGELVLIDWAYVGRAHLGSDLGDLAAAGYPLLSSAPAPAAIDAAVFDAYVEGLQAAGYAAQRRQVRFAYCTHAALKYGCLLVWVPDIHTDARYAFWEQLTGQPMAVWLEKQARMLEHLLRLLEEARGLQAGL